jgi:transcriptional regulator with XRE-family HTH domain
MEHEVELRQFGLEIKRRRTKLGWTQEEFADISGFHRTYISGIERGARNPTLDVVLTLANALDTTAAELLKGAAR